MIETFMTLVEFTTDQQTANAIYRDVTTKNDFQGLRLPLGGLIW